MRVLPFLAITLLACDPSVITRLTVLPPSPYRGADVDSLAVTIARELSAAHGLHPSSGDATCTGGLYEAVDFSGHPVGLALCVVLARPAKPELQVQEAITSRWGPKGDSLRRELRDSLVTHFGRGAVRVR